MTIFHPLTNKPVAEMPEEDYQALLIAMKLISREELRKTATPFEKKIMTIEYFREAVKKGRKGRR
jgi:hypothetical protein